MRSGGREPSLARPELYALARAPARPSTRVTRRRPSTCDECRDVCALLTTCRCSCGSCGRACELAGPRSERVSVLPSERSGSRRRSTRAGDSLGLCPVGVRHEQPEQQVNDDSGKGGAQDRDDHVCDADMVLVPAQPLGEAAADAGDHPVMGALERGVRHGRNILPRESAGCEPSAGRTGPLVYHPGLRSLPALDRATLLLGRHLLPPVGESCAPLGRQLQELAIGLAYRCLLSESELAEPFPALAHFLAIRRGKLAPGVESCVRSSSISFAHRLPAYGAVGNESLAIRRYVFRPVRLDRQAFPFRRILRGVL